MTQTSAFISSKDSLISTKELKRLVLAIVSFQNAKEKARLKTKGKILDDFDLLIGSTAIANNLTLATKNVTDFERLDGIQIEDWTSL